MRIITLAAGLLLGTTFAATAQRVTTPAATHSASHWQRLVHAPKAPAPSSATAARRMASLSRPGRAVHHTWSSITNAWTKASIETYGYDSQGRITHETFADSASGAFLERSLYAYNAQGMPTEEVYQEWNGTAWENNARYVATYDAPGSLTQELYQEWTGTAWQTADGRRFLLTYSPAGFLIGQIEQHWQDGTFRNHEQQLHTVSASGERLTTIQQIWDEGSWVNEARIVLTWHNWSKQQPATYEEQAWQGQWVPDTRGTFTYGANDSYTLVEEQAVSNTAWENFRREKLTYDSQQNETEQLYENWQNNDWVADFGYRTTLRYSATGELLRKLVQQLDARNSSAYVNSDLFTYSNFVLLSNRAKAASRLAAEVYPNPTTGRAVLRWATAAHSAEVLNPLGQTVRTVALPAGTTTHTFDLTGLPAGIYSLRVRTADGTASQRVVKE